MEKAIFSVFSILLFSSLLLAQCPEGDVEFKSQSQIDNFLLNYPDCTEIKGNLIICDDLITNCDIKDLSSFSKLTSVKGSLSVVLNKSLTNLSGLDNLKLIGDNFRFATSEFNIEESDQIIFDLTALNGLISIGGDFFEIAANVGGREFDIVDIKYGFENLISVGGNFDIWNNHKFKLPVFKALKSIGGNLTLLNNDNLFDLSGLENLESIGGNLHIQGNESLIDLGGLHKLSYVGSNLEIYFNSALSNLFGLDNIVLIDKVLTIAGNSSLTSLSGLDNIRGRIEEIRIYDNPMLNNCSISSICSFLANINGDQSATIHSNNEKCINYDKVLENCGRFGLINFQIYYDLNQNKIQNESEPYLTLGSININPGNINLVLYQQSGLDAYYLSPNSYTITLNKEGLNNWKATTDTSYIINLIEDVSETVSFGIYPEKFISEMHTHIQSPATRCNEAILFTVSTKNLGTTTFTKGTLWLENDSSIVSTEFVDKPDTLIPPHQYGWFYENLPPSHTIAKKIRLTIPGPPNFELGNALFFKSFTTFYDENGESKTNENTYETIVRCAYDPNDKLVQPQQECGYTLMGESLNYTIRFQNIGNAEAQPG